MRDKPYGLSLFYGQAKSRLLLDVGFFYYNEYRRKYKKMEMYRMNNVIETMLNHRSVRKFKDEELTKEQITTIVEAAQSASTSSFIQAYSIIGITDKEKRKSLPSLLEIRAMLLRTVMYSCSAPIFTDIVWLQKWKERMYQLPLKAQRNLWSA